MCGIYGTTKQYSDEVVKQKLNLMKFRGPDYQEYQRLLKLNADSVTLGHVRLAIIDLDKRSNQPFNYKDNITIVFNGEIYNFQELKKQHLSEISFRTESDTEVICAMYEKYGKECVKYFNGMFAYVIFDKQHNIFTGARDRLGKKPFYYHLTKSSFEFASQLNPIRYQNDFHVSALSRQFFLLNGYIPDPYCIFEDVSKLRAGQLFTLDLDTYEMKIEQYWDLFTNSCNFTIPSSYNKAKEQVKELLYDAVKIRLNADVPVGMFLSGGIDSSLTSAIVAHFNKDICAYTIGFNDSKYNESSHANEVAKVLGIPIKINYCEGNEMLDVIKDFTKYYDEPFADNSLIPTSFLTQKARQDVTVAIGGDGGDELFYGYNNYFVLPTRKKIMHAPFVLRKILSHVIKPFSNGFWSEFLAFKDLQTSYVAQGGYGILPQGEIFDRIALSKQLPDINYLYSDRGLESFSDYDIKHYMNSCINTKTDRASMRSNIELRSPIMDYRIAEYSRLLPIDYLYSKDLGGKRILKDILYEMVPREILERPKSGFSAPISQWFKSDLKEDITSIFTVNNVERFLPELDSGLITSRLKNLIMVKDSDLLAYFKLYVYMKWCLDSVI